MLNLIICPLFLRQMRKDIKVSSFYRPIKFAYDYAARSRILVVSRWRYYGKLTALGVKFSFELITLLFLKYSYRGWRKLASRLVENVTKLLERRWHKKYMYLLRGIILSTMNHSLRIIQNQYLANPCKTRVFKGPWYLRQLSRIMTSEAWKYTHEQFFYTNVQTHTSTFSYLRTSVL